MTILVNGKLEDLEAIGKNGVEWTVDLLGNHGALNKDEETGEYTMNENDFEWWKEMVEKLNEIAELEENLTDGQREEYETENFDYADLEMEADARLAYLLIL